MRYLSESDIDKIGTDWSAIINRIIYTTECLENKDYAQPLKPYLRFGDKKNRIIAMPAFVGGAINMSGIKWIASFPDNISRGVRRAHSVVVLNDTASGIPIGILNSGSVSAIRTAGVSGMVLRQYLRERPAKKLTVGIIGMGVIGRHHLEMFFSVLQSIDVNFLVYDIAPVILKDFPPELSQKITVVDTWQEAYTPADVFLTATCSSTRYIDLKPKPGSLHMNVSLRDYKSEVFEWFRDQIIVDDWDEVCRENTDIEQFSIENDLTKDSVKTITELATGNCFAVTDQSRAFMFNPMGMAIFDIAVSEHYLSNGNLLDIGTILAD